MESLCPADMTLAEFTKLLHVQSLLRGLPDSYDNLRTTLRANSSITTDEIIQIILQESMVKELEELKTPGMKMSAHAVTPIMSCTTRNCPRPETHTTDRCFIAHPELKRNPRSTRASRIAKEVLATSVSPGLSA
jgi:hypothetical protein